MKTSKIHAHLNINYKSEDEEYTYYNFELFWDGKHFPESPVIGKIEKKRIEEIRKKLSNIPLSIQVLRDIGGMIWNFLPKEIKEQMRKFDKRAKKLLNTSESNVMLTIRTEKLDIPWELSSTGSDIRETDNSYWFRRYLVGRELIGLTRDFIGEIDNRKKNILVIYEPFDLKRIQDQKVREDFEKCNDDFESLIETINNEESRNFDIKSYRFKKGFDYNELCGSIDCSEDIYDVILYVGSYNYNECSLLIENRVDNTLGYKLSTIESFGDAQPLIFFDSCETGMEKDVCVTESKGNGEDVTNLINHSNSIIEKFLDEKGASAFIGTFSKIEGVVATDFAYYFLQSLCFDGSSLAKAVYDARKMVSEKYDKKGDPVSELRHCEACSYVLVGDSTGRLYYSFLYKKKTIKLFWSAIADPYFSSFNREIYTSGLDLDDERMDDFDDLMGKFRESVFSDEIILADIPLIYAIEEITKNDEELVILNSTFRLSPEKEDEDATLYYFGDLKKVESISVHDWRSTVTLMLHVYLDSIGLMERGKAVCEKKDYKDIIGYIRDSMEFNLKRLENKAFLLSGEYKDEFEKIKKTPGVTIKSKDVNLYKEFKEISSKEYNIKGLPASVLVARKKDVEKYKKLFEEIFTRWSVWRKRRFRELYKDLSDRQEQIHELTNDDINTLINFSKFIKEYLKNSIFGRELDIKRELDNDDFIPVKPRKEKYEKTDPLRVRLSEQEISSKRYLLQNQLHTQYNDIFTDLGKTYEMRRGELIEIDASKEHLKRLKEKHEEGNMEDIKSEKEDITNEIEKVENIKSFNSISDRISSMREKIDWRIYEGY